MYQMDLNMFLYTYLTSLITYDFQGHFLSKKSAESFFKLFLHKMCRKTKRLSIRHLQLEGRGQKWVPIWQRTNMKNCRHRAVEKPEKTCWDAKNSLAVILLSVVKVVFKIECLAWKFKSWTGSKKAVANIYVLHTFCLAAHPFISYLACNMVLSPSVIIIIVIWPHARGATVPCAAHNIGQIWAIHAMGSPFGQFRM